MRFLRCLAVILAIAAETAAGASPATAAAGVEDHTGRSYVALGDSYSAGFGLFPYSDQPAAGCYQADANYPYLVAAEFGLVLDDRTCSGAVTANVIDTPQLTITGQGTAPVQSASLTVDTRIVTVTIGGNDLGFADVAESCIGASATGPLLWDIDGLGYQNCRDAYVRTVDGIEIDLLRDRIEQVVAPRLAATFALIAQRAPSATIIVVGYPTIAPDFANVPGGGCYRSPLGPSGLLPPFPADSFPFSDIDTLYLHATEVRLDAAIAAAAEGAGATFISTLAQTTHNSACATDGNVFIAGVTLTNDGTTANSTPIGDTGYGVLLGALHPNTAGVAFLQQQVAAAIRAAVLRDENPASGSGTSEPAADPSGPALAASGAPPVAIAVMVAAALIAGGTALTGARRRTPQAGRRPSVTPADPGDRTWYGNRRRIPNSNSRV